ncbi:g protein-coupled receptor [Anaeramoeba ignava]|uniref:G protein-coupled receptor n=1 Tax=Anaeramoeba ignava TaxID=1746090 RepID=A0A9Q0RBR4_ANAIG|nr:g protein-coupled receptor [Anaeramoeba ignava]
MVNMIHNKESIPCIIGSTIGMAGSLIFILVYLFLKEIRDSARKYIIILSICDFLLGFFAILPGPSSTGLCHTQAFFMSFLFIASCSFIFLASLVFYLKFCHDKNVDQSPIFFIWGFVLIIIVALIVSIITISFSPIASKDTHWCWVTKHKIEAIVYSIVWVTLLGTLILYSLFFFQLRGNTRISKSFQYKMFALGWIYVFTELWTSIKRARQLANENASDSSVLDFTQALFLPMLGLWDSVFFVFFDKNVRNSIKNRFSKYPKFSSNNLTGYEIFSANGDNQLQALDTSDTNDSDDFY